MKKAKKWVVAPVMLAAMSSMLLSACGSNGNDNANTNANANANANAGSGNADSASGDTSNAPANTTADLEPVTLKYYYPAAPQPDQQAVQDAMNKILKEKINAEIELYPIPFENYEQKMKVMINTQEEFDLAFTAPWVLNYNANATNGAYADLTDILPKYAPNLYASLKPELWNAAKVNGKLYASINQQIFARQFGFWYNKEFTDKYNVDYTKIETLKDFSDYLLKVKAGEPADRTDRMTWKADWLDRIKEMKGWESVGGSDTPGAIVSSEANPKVFNEYDTPEYKETIELAKELQTAGVIPKDVLTAANWDRSKMFGAVTSVAPGAEQAEAQSNSMKEVVMHGVGSPTLTTNNVTATMTAVSATSKNPERAAMFLELINTDKDLYNLLCHGIEGTHYTKVGDNKYENIKDSKYSPGSDWMFGNQFNGLIPVASPDDVWEQTKKLNESATASVLLGFVYDDSNIKTEAANCAAVIAQYKDVFAAGLYGGDTDKKYEQFLSDLKKAGLDKILADKQAQVDKFIAGKA
ncbi:ABC transporter substrate-binding protein [Paenibacillus sacheonensis]|uniref:DUF3502 domain-containing protein n=1 Tax=Paenibacillus sacheonensis TaxID=742054 RepID=A0A7X5C1B6_9BACL|nr:ABC transporter substrate-binding protein [Paenibacillus sacheonensis]MBM7568901.1 putative aldouronate transport system substrate-binding protein [Paenibacillus sacheonensis]NBC72602.1 DUF3502 domain-containing protein [Paenibacillus sacheonensis]